MAYKNSDYQQFDAYDEDDGLNAMGRKNAKHAEELHDEVVRTCETIARFLEEQLIAAHPDDWQEVCVDAAFAKWRDGDVNGYLPNHYELANYDCRSLATVLEYNLPILEFKRDARVTPGEIRSFVRIRNLYEHKSQQLNARRWRSDLESILSFRAKMQSDEEIADEVYSVDDLSQMEIDSAQYLARLDSLEHKIEAMTNTILGMDDRLTYSAQVDEDQFAELDRQYDTDEEHDRSIGELDDRLEANTQLDDEQAAELELLREASAEHGRSIAELTDKLSELSAKVTELEQAVGKKETLEKRLFLQGKGLVGAAASIAAIGVGSILATALRRE